MRWVPVPSHLCSTSPRSTSAPCFTDHRSKSVKSYGFLPSVGSLASISGAGLQIVSPGRARRSRFLLATLLSLPLAAVPRVDSFPITLAMLFLVSGFTIGGLAYAGRQFSAKHTGLIAGLGSGSWSAVVALEMPLIGGLFDLHWYSAAFALATVLPVAGYSIWRVLDCRGPHRTATGTAGPAPLMSSD